MAGREQRVGLGTDIHRLEEGRPWVLGGVSIDFSSGPVGHSDADVLAHALCDALLGAVALGDIGAHFPDDDPQYEGISSLLLLDRVVARLRAEGWKPVNVDCVVHAERPRLAPYRRAIAKRLGEHLALPEHYVGVKAKTAEGLGAVGRGEAVAATCVCLVERVGADETR